MLDPLSWDTVLPRPSNLFWYNNILGPSDGVNGSGGDFHSVTLSMTNQDTIIKAHLSNTADFIGIGNVALIMPPQ